MTEIARSFLPTDPITSVLYTLICDSPQIKKTAAKITGLLHNYAERRGTTFCRLRVMDIFNSHGKITSKLMAFINSMPSARKQTEKRFKQYQNEIRANLRRIANFLFKASPVLMADVPQDAPVSEGIPEMIRPALPYLPREVERKRICFDKRMDFPLTERGQIMLVALLNVYKTYNPLTLESLLVDFSREVFQALMGLAPSARKDGLPRLIYSLKERLGFKSKPPTIQYLEKSQWPLKLRQEWEVFEKLAQSGLAASISSPLFRGKSVVTIKRFSGETLSSYETALSYALTVIPFDTELSILDLVRTVPVEEVSNGRDKPLEKNLPTDLFQKCEQAKKGLVKNKGFDSNLFRNYTCAVKAVAINNGYGRYVNDFSEACPIILDVAATEQRKEDLKATFTIEWVDSQIEILLPRFKRIINTQSFIRRPGRLREANSDLFFVLFYICLVTLRYMGYRQQSLVNCKIGENFILNADGSITLRFNKTKNNRRLYMELNESRSDTHGMLQDILSLYYKRVYPYLVQESGNTLDGHLFVAKGQGKTLFRRFKHARHFSKFFKEGCRKFLALDSLDSQIRDKFHPHFLRGLCADWLITVLHMTFDEAGEVLGDDPATLKKKYVNKNRVCDAGYAFDTAGARSRSRTENSETQNQLQEVLKKLEDLQNQLNQKDQEIAALR